MACAGERLFRQIPRVPLAPVFCCLSAGIFLADRLIIHPFWFWLPAAGLLLLSAWLFRLGNPAGVPLLLLAALLLGSASFSTWRKAHFPQGWERLLQLKQLSLSCRVVSLRRYPRTLMELEVRSVNGTPLPAGSHLRVQFWSSQEPQSLREEGQQVHVNGARLAPLPRVRNPGQFNYRRYLKLRGICARLSLGRNATWQVERPSSKPLAARMATVFRRIRQHLATRLDRLLLPEAAAFSKALLLGQRQFLSRSLLEDYQNAGVIHVLAISGLHVGFLAVMFYLGLSFLPVGFKKRNVLLIFLLFAYMLLVGNRPPVVRATVMASLILLARNLERKHSTFNAFCAAGCLILVAAPYQLFWIGFQLSFAAVASILIGYPLLEKLLPEHWRHRPGGRLQQLLLNGLVRPFLVTVSAQLGTLPLTVFYFQKLPLISFLLNLLVIPWIGLLVLLGILMLVTSFFSWQPAFLMGDFIGFLTHTLNRLIHQAASLPLAYLPMPPHWTGWILLLLGTAMFVKLTWGTARPLALTGALVTVLFLGTRAIHPAPLQILQLDVGQGDALLLLTPAGHTVLFDTGPANRYGDAGTDVILPVIRYLGIHHIERIFISHPHQDHLGGLFSLLKQVPVDSVYWPVMPIMVPELTALKTICRQAGVGWRALRAGQWLALDATTRLYLLNPLPSLLEYSEPTGSNINNNSLVVLVQHGTTRALITGDIESPAETCLLGWNRLLKCDVFKVPHHGSHTSSSTPFLRAVLPEIGLLSVGKNNPFGLPDPDALQRLQTWIPHLYRTDRQGAIWLQYAGPKNGWQYIQWHRRERW